MKHLLIATDGSELAEKAIQQGLELAKLLNAKITFVTVTPMWRATEMAELARSGSPHPIDEYETQAAKWARSLLAKCAEAAAALGVSCTSIHVPDNHPAAGILTTCDSSGCDMIVMSSHGRRGIKGLLLGSIASEVVASSKKTVVICR